MQQSVFWKIILLLVVSILPWGTARGACYKTATVDGSGDGDLQSLIDSVPRGQTICLQQGKTYMPKAGSFILPGKKGDGYVTIMTENIDAVAPPNTRVTPGTNFAKIVSSSTLPAVKTGEFKPVKGTPWWEQFDLIPRYYRLVGLEIRAPADVYTAGLVILGDAKLTTNVLVPHHFELDRVFIHGDANRGGKRGIEVHSRQTVIKNSRISGFGATGQETNAIFGLNGTKDLLILNNYIEAGAINILFGGAVPALEDPDTPGEGHAKWIPENIAILHNHITKDPAWETTATSGWQVKNLIETKLARKLVIEGNVFENSWRQGQQEQSGSAVVFKAIPGAGCAVFNAVTENVLFRHNRVRHTGAGFEIRARESACIDPELLKKNPETLGYMGIVRHVKIIDNLFEDINSVEWPGSGRLFGLYMGPLNLAVNHNTFVQSRTETEAVHFEKLPKGAGFKFTNNITHHGTRGVASGNPPPESAIGNVALKNWTDWTDVAGAATTSVFQRNVLVGGGQYKVKYKGNCPDTTPDPTGLKDKCYPEMWQEVGFKSFNTGDYQLLPNGAFSKKGIDPFTLKGDGKDLGADINAVLRQTEGVDAQAAVAPAAMDSRLSDTQAFVDAMPKWITSKLHNVEDGSHVLVNDSVSFSRRKGSTLAKGNAPYYGCPADTVGIQELFGDLKNIKAEPLSDIVLQITSLPNGNQLVLQRRFGNAETGVMLLGEGDFYGLPYFDGPHFFSQPTHEYDDGELAKGESVKVFFIVCLKSMSQYDFRVNVLALR